MNLPTATTQGIPVIPAFLDPDLALSGGLFYSAPSLTFGVLCGIFW